MLINSVQINTVYSNYVIEKVILEIFYTAQ